MKISSTEAPTTIELSRNETLVINNLRDMTAFNYTVGKVKSIYVRVYDNFFEVIFNKTTNKVYSHSAWSFSII